MFATDHIDDAGVQRVLDFELENITGVGHLSDQHPFELKHQCFWPVLAVKGRKPIPIETKEESEGKKQARRLVYPQRSVCIVPREYETTGDSQKWS